MASDESSTPRSPIIDTLQKQLTGLNAAVDAAGERWMNLEHLQFDISMEMPPLNESAKKKFRNEIVKLRSLERDLERLRDTTRQTINKLQRPFLRPLKILDLPDELLRLIFLHVRGRTTISELAFYDFSGGNVEQVKKLRLTCKRFCENSSHLLMFYVKVEMTSESLAHLDEVSRHP